MRLYVLTPFLSLSLALGAAGCSAKSSTGDDSGVTNADSGPITQSDQDGDSILDIQEGTDDADGDGFTTNGGDCNDCDRSSNPGAYDYPGDGIDQDCSGVPDDEVASCDAALATDGDAFAAARALGLCRMQTGASWGVVNARWVFPDGTTTSLPVNGLTGGCAVAGAPPNPQSHGILEAFGTQVHAQEGASFLALSSGVARSGTQTATAPGSGDSPSGAQMCTLSKMPTGFPKPASLCSVAPSTDTSANDAIALELELRVPTNARSLSFDFDFYTYEWPNYVCSQYNDSFAAVLAPAPAGVGVDGNVAFDASGSPIGANSSLLAVCQPGTSTMSTAPFPCGLGVAQLAGTGFDSGTTGTAQSAATGWVRTTTPVVAGKTVTLRLSVWDAGDEVLDSTVLVDRFAWSATAALSPTTVAAP